MYPILQKIPLKKLKNKIQKIKNKIEMVEDIAWSIWGAF
jgi:hypothetical protein